MSFSGKVAVVTGAASGIGRALAIALAKSGAKLVLVDHNEAGLNAVVKELGDAHVHAFPKDVRDPETMIEAVRFAEENFDGLDFVFNIAGIGVLGEARDHSLEDWNNVIDTNLRGVINGVHAAYPRMIARKNGHIINTGSMSGWVPMPANIAYVASKAGVIGLTQALREEAAPHNVRVTLVCPTAVTTPMVHTNKMINFDPDEVMASLPGGAISPEACAGYIMRGVSRNAAVVRPGAFTFVLWFAHRWFPFLTHAVIRSLVKKFAKMRKAPRQRS